MNNNNTLAIRQTLNNRGASAAELQLIEIGHEAGDEQLALVVGELNPAEVAVIVGEGDYTKPSIVSHFITPEQFLGALERFGARWGRLQGDLKHNPLTRMQSEVADFVLSVVLQAKDDRQHEMVATLLDDPLGREVVVLMSLDEDRFPEFLREEVFNVPDAQKGTWQELYALVSETNPAEFAALQLEVASCYPDDFDYEGTKKHPARKKIEHALKAMARRAAELVEQTPEGVEKAEEVFSEV